MLNLKQWRTRCKDAKEIGKFTAKDKRDCVNPCQCAIGECAKILKVTYNVIKQDTYTQLGAAQYHDLLEAEGDFMTAVKENKPNKALTAIGKIERIINRIKDKF